MRVVVTGATGFVGSSAKWPPVGWRAGDLDAVLELME